MLECRNCGASLRYDIGTGQMICNHCQSTFTPWEVGHERVAGEPTAIPSEAQYQTMIFTCPQCGGEITSYQNEATEFCSFCGSSVVLSGRLSTEQRPKYIVPFSVTKENGLESYKRHIKNIPFVPKQIKNPDSSKVCGIYMPFWVFRVEQKGHVNLKGKRSSGDYTEYCELGADLDTTYEKICYDASVAFDDNLARQVAPFDFATAVDFNPAYLCGFYTDTADVDSKVYEQKALEEAADQTVRTLAGSDSNLNGITFNKGSNKQIPGKITGTERALLPVWFLTNRSGNRVMYSVVNGIDGKVTADVPVDLKKFYIIAAVLGAALTALLYFLMPVILPDQALKISYFIAFLGFLTYMRNFTKRVEAETHADDPGFAGDQGIAGRKRRETFYRILWIVILIIVFWLSITIIALNNVDANASVAASSMLSLLFFLGLGGTLLLTVINIGKLFKIKDKRIWRDILPMLAAGALSTAVLLLKPVFDYYYYGATILVGAALLILLTGMLTQFNMLSTRPIPELHNRKRGDGNV